MNKCHTNEFGSWLKKQRLLTGYSTVRLAREVGINDATITRIEHGSITAPDPKKLAGIARVLRLDLADVYARAGYAVADQLPSFEPYLRQRYGDLPPAAMADLDQAFAEVIARHGYVPGGPTSGEDETPDPHEFD